MTVGILRIPKKLPQDQRDWEQFTRTLNETIQYDGERAVVQALTRLSTRTGTDMDTLLSFIADTGRAEDQRFLPIVSAANKSSLQSVQPLTAVDAGSNATIGVAAHSVQYGFGTVAYNAGSITGLSYSTLYYVYADDPTYAGGAATYLATTNALTVTSANGRYYLGAITTPAAAGPPSGGGWGGGGGGGGSQIP